MIKKDLDTLLTSDEFDDDDDVEADVPDIIHAPATPIIDVIDYPLEQFTAVTEEADDKETTISDLQILNNHMAMVNGILPHLRTADMLFKSAQTAIKLVEARRKVKKLEYGKQGTGKGTFEILE